MLTDEQLKEIKERCEVANHAPWTAKSEKDIDSNNWPLCKTGLDENGENI